MDTLFDLIRPLIPRPLFHTLQPWYHGGVAMLASIMYGFPSLRLRVIGVTGTNGKTTVVHILHEGFSGADVPVASLSSLAFRIKDEKEINRLKMTMPSGPHISRFLSQARSAGCKYAILEVTSEGLHQRRHFGTRFWGGVMTNVTPEHIEAHGSFAAYRAAKLLLFQALPKNGVAVINRDDPSSDLFAKHTRAKTVFYSTTEIRFHDRVHTISTTEDMAKRLTFRLDEVTVGVELLGAFNGENIRASTAMLLASGVPPDRISGALGHVRPPEGRLQYVFQKPFAAVVDYAHTPDALRKLYDAIPGDIVAVLGSAGGGRDTWKRPEMARIAALRARVVILTSEDPDDEDPRDIIDEMHRGVPDNLKSKISVVVDRRGAIREAMLHAKIGETVVITGMGAQPWFVSEGGEKIPWDEAKIAREEYAKATGETL